MECVGWGFFSAFYFDDFFLFQSGSNSTSTGSSGSVSGSGKKPFFLHPPNEAQGELTGNGKSNAVCGQQLPPDISSGHKILAGADRANQGNLLRGIDNWSSVAPLGLYQTSRPVRMSGKFSKSGLSGNRTFSFANAGLFNTIEIRKKIKLF